MAKFYSNLELNGNSIINFIADPVASDPVSGLVEGRVIYNTTEDVLKVYNGTSWEEIGANVPNILNLKGSIDASTNPDYPAAVAGDTYIITVAGTVGGVSGKLVEAGDYLVAVTDNIGGNEASVGANWIVLQRNLEAASETNAGYIEIATQAETDAGVDDSRAVTPLKLETRVNSKIDTLSFSNDNFDITVPNTPTNVVHGLGSSNVIVQVYNDIDEQIFVGVQIVDNNTVALTSSIALTSLRVVVYRR